MNLRKKLHKIVKHFLANNEPRRAAALLAQKHPEDVADVLERLDDEERVLIFKYLPLELQADVLIRLDEEIIDKMLDHLSDKDISELVGEMDVDDAVDIIQELEPEERMKVLSMVPEFERKQVEELLNYPENTAGGLMTTTCIRLNSHLKVKDALEHIRRIANGEVERLHLIYLVDKDGKFVGVVPLSRLLRAKEDQKLEELTESVPTVPPHMDQEEVARLVEKYDVFEIPVVSDDGRLLGVITADDLMDVIEEEATEDIAKFGGLGEAESIYLPPHKSAIRRLPWLYINLITALIAASVVGLFKKTIDAVVYLAVFMPVVAGMGGNAGTQALAITVRSLALGEVDFSDVKKLLFKEILTGILVGIAVGFITGVIAYIWVGKPFFGVLVAMALLGNMIVACIAGFLIPLGLKVLGQDPALASGVIVTTFTDVTGFLLFLGLATVFIDYLQ